VIRRYVSLPWGQVHVTLAGEGPPLLLVHSLPRSGEEFRDVVARVPGRTCVALDLPGLGASDAYPEPVSIERMASAAWEVCDALDLGMVAVVGHHGGGVIAVEMAASAPGRVECLVLSSTPWLDDAERTARKKAGVYYGFPASNDLSHVLKMADRRRPWMPADRPELWNGVVVDVLRAVDPEAPIRALTEYRMEDRIRLVTCPTLVLARRGDTWFEQRHVLASHLQHAEIEVVDGTVLVEDTPDVLVGAVTAFLSRHR
jgi:pimeloyl-ACP methyl ester carboxylesterase